MYLIWHNKCSLYERQGNKTLSLIEGAYQFSYIRGCFVTVRFYRTYSFFDRLFYKFEQKVGSFMGVKFEYIIKESLLG